MNIMKTINVCYVTERNLGGVIALYFSAKSATGQPFIVELKAAGTSVQSLVKSANPKLSENLNDSIQKIIR